MYVRISSAILGEETARQIALLHEENFTIFRQSPNLIVNNLFKFVNLYANTVKVYRHGVVIEYRLLARILNNICSLTALYHLANKRLNGCGAILDIGYKLGIGC